MTRLFFSAALAFYRASKAFLWPVRCRHWPSCSSYAEEAVHRHGTAGLWMAVKRVARCRPWGGGGYDPVPENP